MKYVKFFLLLISQFVLIEFVIWFHTCGLGWHVEELLPGDAISLWGTITTIVFLVFSVLALWNIDQKIQELNSIKHSISEKFNNIENKNREVMQEADKAQKDIVKQAEVQIKNILNKSTYRQKFYDTLTRIANIPDPSRQVQEYTHFLRTSGNIEGINYAYVYISRGNAYMELSRKAKAFADYEMAARLDTKTVAPYYSLGHYYVVEKDFKKSIEIFEKGLTLDPQDENMMMNIANSYSAMGNYEKADEYFDKALTFNPDLAIAYYNKAKLVIAKKEDLWKEKSMNYLNHCIQIMPFFYQSNISKASLLREDNKNEEAESVLSKVIGGTFNEDLIMAILQRGITYRLQNKLPMALNDFNTVLLYAPYNIQNLSNLSQTYFAMGYLNEAHFYAQLGLKEAQKQDNHFCDMEFNNVLMRIQVMSGMTIPISKGNTNNEGSENTNPEK
jgi:tetratricopeptide (TPR) repeat protein